MTDRKELSASEYEQIIKKLEQINDELLNTVLAQSRYIREMEEISKAKKLPIFLTK